MKGGKAMNNITYTKKDIGLNFKVGQIICYKMGSVKFDRKCKILKYWINGNDKGYFVKVEDLTLRLHLSTDEVYIKSNTIRKL